MRLASPRPFVLRYREPDRLSAPRTPLSTLLGPNTGMRQQNPFGLSRTEGPDLAVDNILKNAFGPQVPDSPLQANDFDEENPDQGQSSGLEGLLSSILGNGAPQGLSGQGSNNNNVDDGSDFANLLKGLMSPQNGSAGDFLGNLLKPAGLSPSRNKIVVPASQEAEEPNLLDLLNLGPNDSPQADDDQNPLVQLLGGAASGEDADDSGPSNIGNLLSGLLGPASPPVQMDNENPRLKALRQRLPVVDFDAKVPLINNFYNIKGIRNAGRPLVFPPLGHRARPIIPTPVEQPTQIVYHHRRHHHQRRHHQYRRYTRTTQAPQAPTREDPIAALLGSLLAGGAEDTKLAKI